MVELTDEDLARTSRRGLGGLGRGLAGILETVPESPDKTPGPAPGLGQLLGNQTQAKAVGVRAFVIETALAAIADAFGADGVIMISLDRSSGRGGNRPMMETGVHQADRNPSPGLTLRLPPSWGPGSPALFELYGILWEMLNTEGQHCSRCGTNDRPLDHRQAQVDSHWGWFCRLDDGTAALAAALVRATPFDDDEADALARSMRSVAWAVSPSGVDGQGQAVVRAKAVTNVAVASEIDSGDMANAITAEVTVQNRRQTALSTSGGAPSGSTRSTMASLTATGRGPDIETAVARAAANACQPQCRIHFAGSSDVDGNTISIVTISDESGSPRLGVSVRPLGDYTGVAEAVFSAASPGGIPRQG